MCLTSILTKSEVQAGLDRCLHTISTIPASARFHIPGSDKCPVVPSRAPLPSVTCLMPDSLVRSRTKGSITDKFCWGKLRGGAAAEIPPLLHCQVRLTKDGAPMSAETLLVILIVGLIAGWLAGQV